MAIGYIRVSTSGQASDDKFGIGAQKKAILEYAAKNGYEIEDFVVDTISGVKDNREGFDTILLGQYATDAVIVYKSDRVARETKLYFYYLYSLEKMGIKLISVTEEFDEGDAMANIYRAILQFVAEQERNNIRLRTMAGRKLKKMTGGYAGGNYPYGYFVARGRLYADGDEKKIVRRIYKLYYEGLGSRQIAWALSRDGIKTRKGKDFSDSQVAKTLRNRKFYEGFVLVDGEWVRGEQDAILKEGEFIRPDYDYFANRVNDDKYCQIKGIRRTVDLDE